MDSGNETILEGSMENLAYILGMEDMINWESYLGKEYVVDLYGRSTLMGKAREIYFPVFFYPKIFELFLRSLWLRSEDKGRSFLCYGYPCRIVSHTFGYMMGRISSFRRWRYLSQMIAADKKRFFDYYGESFNYEIESLKLNNGLKHILVETSSFLDSSAYSRLHLSTHATNEIRRFIERCEVERDSKIMIMVMIYYRKVYSGRHPVDYFTPYITAYLPEKADDSGTDLHGRVDRFLSLTRDIPASRVRDLENYYWKTEEKGMKGGAVECLLIDAIWIQWL